MKYVFKEDDDCRGIVGIPTQLWRAFNKSGVTVTGVRKGTTCYLAFDEQLKPHICYSCGEKFCTYKSLRYHLETTEHTKTYGDSCGQYGDKIKSDLSHLQVLLNDYNAGSVQLREQPDYGKAILKQGKIRRKRKVRNRTKEPSKKVTKQQNKEGIDEMKFLTPDEKHLENSNQNNCEQAALINATDTQSPSHCQCDSRSSCQTDECPCFKYKIPCTDMCKCNSDMCRNHEETRQSGCNCNDRSKCKRTKCDCFRKGIICTDDCSCDKDHCENTELRTTRKEQYRKSKGKAAQFNVDLSSSPNCNCMRAKCGTYKCPCRSNARTCTSDCSCNSELCKNTDLMQSRQEQYYISKKRMRKDPDKKPKLLKIDKESKKLSRANPEKKPHLMEIDKKSKQTSRANPDKRPHLMAIDKKSKESSRANPEMEIDNISKRSSRTDPNKRAHLLHIDNKSKQASRSNPDKCEKLKTIDRQSKQKSRTIPSVSEKNRL